MAAAPERAGVVRDDKTGEMVIPASQRPDGSWRKPRRVKDGYVPQEEVPTFQTKGNQWRDSKPDYPIGLGKDDIEKMKKAKEAQIEASTNAAVKAKNTKRKDKRQKDGDKKGGDSVSKGIAGVDINSDLPKDNAHKEIANKIKTLKKKLREVKELEEKIASGDVKPTKQQTDKVQRKQNLIDEIEELHSKKKA